MIVTITKRARQDGKLAWGYSFFAGGRSAGKRIQPESYPRAIAPGTKFWGEAVDELPN